jgi:hypothetical protein
MDDMNDQELRRCIECCDRPCTVRFGCGHSCFCSECLGAFISNQPSFVGSECPICRVPILLDEMENELEVALEPGFITPLRTTQVETSEASDSESGEYLDDEKEELDDRVSLLTEIRRAQQRAAERGVFYGRNNANMHRDRTGSQDRTNVGAQTGVGSSNDRVSLRDEIRQARPRGQERSRRDWEDNQASGILYETTRQKARRRTHGND